MQKKNVTIDLSVLVQEKSGVPIYVENLVDELYKIKSKNITLDFISSTPIPTFEKKYKFKAYPNIWSYKKIFWENFFMGQKIKPHIYHNPLFLLPRFGLSKKLKTIVTIHDLAFLEQEQSFNFKTKIYFKLLLKNSLKRADAIIAISQNTSDSIKYFFPEYKDKIKVIYNGFNDFRKYSDSINKKPRKRPFFLQVGCTHARKNIELSINNYLKIKKTNNIDLILVSTTEEQKNLYKNIPGLVFLDNVPEIELYHLYKHALATLYPSQYEGFGFPILEAMSSGCPVICSNIPSSKEISGLDDSLMFNLKNPDEIFCHMKKIINDRIYRDTLIKHGNERVDSFSWKKMAKDVLSLYESL